MPISSRCAAAHAGTSSSRSSSVGGAQARLPRLGRLLEHVDGLARPVVARIRHPSPHLGPQLVDRRLLADDHARLPARGRVGERAAALARRNDVRADVAERDQPLVALERGEATEPAPRDVFEEDALDRLLCTEVEDLVERRADEPCGRDEARL